MFMVERQGSVARLVYSAGKGAVGPVSDLPTLLGLFVAQMAKEGFTAEDICSVLRKTLKKLGRPS